MIMSQNEYSGQQYEQVSKLTTQLQTRIDTLQDENISLKLKITEVEDELINERQNKAIKYEVTMENFKSGI